MEDAEQRRSESDVGARLRAARDAAGLSIAEVAQVTRVNARHLAAIEAGRGRPLADAVAALERELLAWCGPNPPRDDVSVLAVERV